MSQSKFQLHGGIGIIHANFATVEEQAAEVSKVKRYKQGFITNPQCIKPTDTVRDLMLIKAKYGFTGTPVTDTGVVGGKQPTANSQVGQGSGIVGNIGDTADRVNLHATGVRAEGSGCFEAAGVERRREGRVR